MKQRIIYSVVKKQVLLIKHGFYPNRQDIFDHCCW